MTKNILRLDFDSKKLKTFIDFGSESGPVNSIHSVPSSERSCTVAAYCTTELKENYISVVESGPIVMGTIRIR